MGINAPQGPKWEVLRGRQAEEENVRLRQQLVDAGNLVSNIEGLANWDKEIREKEHIAEVAEFGIDALTGTMTRKFFEAALEEELAHIRGENPEHRRGELPHKEVALLFIDLDKFKETNDTHGHAAGDEALKAAAQVFMHSVRHETDKVGRKGGDEFVVMLPGADQMVAELVANKILEGLRADPILSRYGITASIGVSTSAVSTKSNELMISADQAMYRAKKGGKNQFST